MKCGGRIQRWERQIPEREPLKSRIKGKDRCGDGVRVLNVEPRVKLDRFEGDQQSKRLRVKLERVKTHERDVKKHERPIKCKIRIAMRSTERDETRRRKTTQSWMIIASDVL